MSSKLSDPFERIDRWPGGRPARWATSEVLDLMDLLDEMRDADHLLAHAAGIADQTFRGAYLLMNRSTREDAKEERQRRRRMKLLVQAWNKLQLLRRLKDATQAISLSAWSIRRDMPRRTGWRTRRSMQQLLKLAGNQVLEIGQRLRLLLETDPALLESARALSMHHLRMQKTEMDGVDLRRVLARHTTHLVLETAIGLHHGLRLRQGRMGDDPTKASWDMMAAFGSDETGTTYLDAIRHYCC